MFAKYLNNTYFFFFSESKKSLFERFIFLVAIVAFIMHCGIIGLVRLDIVPNSVYGDINADLSLLSAIYTPFSIIILYEIYLLMYYLPKSITVYLGKQYEIIALILIRRIFDDLARVSTYNDIFDFVNIKELLLTFGGLLLLLLLIFSFYKLRGKPDKLREDGVNPCTEKEQRFILIKKVLAIILVIAFIILFIASFSQLFIADSIRVKDIVYLIKEMSYGFFNTFFKALILTEVLLLLFTFDLSDSFSKVIRNSGFIISTILLKLSFDVSGIKNIAVILVAVAFGVAMLAIYKLFKKKLGGSV